MKTDQLPIRIASPSTVDILLTFFQIPNMVPMDTKQSMLDDPSKGSKVTMYFPLLFASTSMTFSFSSETKAQVVKEFLSWLMKRSLEMMSSFFCSSPVTLEPPAIPYLLRDKK